MLADRILKQPIRLEVYGHDRHRRVLAVIHQGHTNINRWLVRSGLAWAYRGGRNDAPAPLKRELEAAEQEARQAMRGQWADLSPEPPWLFRQRNRLGR